MRPISLFLLLAWAAVSTASLRAGGHLLARWKAPVPSSREVENLAKKQDIPGVMSALNARMEKLYNGQCFALGPRDPKPLLGAREEITKTTDVYDPPGGSSVTFYYKGTYSERMAFEVQPSAPLTVKFGAIYPELKDKTKAVPAEIQMMWMLEGSQKGREILALLCGAQELHFVHVSVDNAVTDVAMKQYAEGGANMAKWKRLLAGTPNGVLTHNFLAQLNVKCHGKDKGHGLFLDNTSLDIVPGTRTSCLQGTARRGYCVRK